MNTDAFQRWMGRTGLLAALFLLLVPTTTRLMDAAHGAHGPHSLHATIHEGAHAWHGREGRADPGDLRPAIGDPDCDYCPLLAALLAIVPRVPMTATPLAVAPQAVPAAPRVAWLHPNGLGSRGPPPVG